MAKPKLGNTTNTGPMVEAWSEGYKEGMPDNHKVIAGNGYRTGLHDGMAFVADMVAAGYDIAHIIDRCRARMTSLTDNPLTPQATYWVERQASMARAQDPHDHGANYERQHLD